MRLAYIFNILKTARRELPFRLWLGILINAFLAFNIVWETHPIAGDTWTKDSFVQVSGLCFVPIATLVWAILSPPSWQHQALFLRRVIQMHALAALCIALASCAEKFSLLTIQQGYGSLVIVGWIFFLVDLGLLTLLPKDGSPQNQVCAYRKRFVVVVGGALLVLFGWSYGNAALVAWQAEKLSRGYPYCIEVAVNHYRTEEISNLLQLRGLQMQTPWGGGSTSYQFVFHAILVTAGPSETEFRNWTYRGQTFVLIPSETRRLLHFRTSCKPKIDFVGRISIW
jgi:hypothetical protein